MSIGTVAHLGEQWGMESGVLEFESSNLLLVLSVESGVLDLRELENKVT
jgi:hypothetical protein